VPLPGGEVGQQEGLAHPSATPQHDELRLGPLGSLPGLLQVAELPRAAVATSAHSEHPKSEHPPGPSISAMTLC
jgi:hypothetical protein